MVIAIVIVIVRPTHEFYLNNDLLSASACQTTMYARPALIVVCMRTALGWGPDVW